MKQCTKCGKVLPETEYFYKNKKAGRLHSYCKTCSRESKQDFNKDYYEKHGDKIRQSSKERNQRVREENNQKMLEYLSAHPCVDCGESDPVVLEFDHKDPGEKEYNIAWIRTFAWNKILKEIEKCDVVCANCHRRRTAKQFGWYKQ